MTAQVTPLIDLSPDLTPDFFKDKQIKKGKVLIFANGKHFKIIRLNRSKKKCFVEEVKLYTEDEINAMRREDAEEIIKGQA